ncbi:MAG: type II toxin-antitoxin system RelE/ParE family toxin [Bacteroidota bacterium]
MVKEIIWTPEAERTYDTVIAYLLEDWTNAEARKFIEKVNSIVNHISRHPLAYRSAGKEDVREAVITKHNILLYRISGSIIYLLYFWDTRKNPSRKPPVK